MKVSIDINAGDTEQLSGLGGPGLVSRFSQTAGPLVARVFRQHFLKKEGGAKKPPRSNWPKTHFWAEMSEKVSSANAGPDGFDVLIADRRYGIHVEGGEVRPRTKKALTIPIHELAYGRRASEVPHEVFRPKGTNILAANINGVFTKLYALAKSAEIPRDPDALPPDTLVEAGLERALAITVRALGGGEALA